MQTWLSLQCFCSLVSHACLSAYELEWKAWGSCLHPRRCEILRDWSQELLIEKLKHAFSCGFCHCAWENLEPCTEVWCGGWRSHLEKWRHYWEWFWGFWYPEILCGIMISYFVSAETMHVMGISKLIYKLMKDHTCAGCCLFPLVLHLLSNKFSCCTIDLQPEPVRILSLCQIFCRSHRSSQWSHNVASWQGKRTSIPFSTKQCL